MKNLKHTTKLIVFLSILLFANNSQAQNSHSDITRIFQIVNEFYDWYISAIESSDVYQPQFVETKTGMTTLDFSPYCENLRKYRFSDALIQKEKESYSKCIENLKMVQFSEFGETKFVDLDDFEETYCDFGNRFRWIGGMESSDGIRIHGVQFISVDTAVVSIDYAEYAFDEESDKGYVYFSKESRNELIVVKQNNDWYIDAVDSFEGEECRTFEYIIEHSDKN
ncbi:MAG: hypothetical protein LBR55_04980 [Bacteroidales bacterium]|jgi:hypothetical protein|nr:hypothetical protein [Bacteroidales bacterium]